MFPANAKRERFSLELVSPIDPKLIPTYYERQAKLFQFTNQISLSSHPVSNDTCSISGFDRNYNLAKYMISQWPYFDIVFHLTCYDLNRANIHARLHLLRILNIRRVLIVSGDLYRQPDRYRTMYFGSSADIVEFIQQNYPNLFESVAIAGYPKSEGESFSDELHVATKARFGAKRVYTQCLFDWKSYESYEKLLSQSATTRNLEIVPSIALFKNVEGLDKVILLAGFRVVGNIENLRKIVERYQHSNQHDLMLATTKEFFINLCKEFVQHRPNVLINLCLLGLVDMAYDVIVNVTQCMKNCNETPTATH